MKHFSLAGLIWTVSFALPVALAAAPGEARACGSAVYLERARPRAPEAPKPVEVKRPVEAPKPVDIVPPFPAPKPANIVPPFPAPKPKPRLAPPPPVVDRPLLVADAEQALSEGKTASAAARVVAAFPALRRVAPGSLTLADRALRVLALATVRTGGRLQLGGTKVRTDADRTANLEWAAEVLGGLSARRANNPSYQTDHGEALARLPARRAEAERLLGDLADRDLVTSAEGYAALARLRADGDEATREALRRRCEVMTRTPALCTTLDTAATAGRS
jgi:CBS domain-containing protein